MLQSLLTTGLSSLLFIIKIVLPLLGFIIVLKCFLSMNKNIREEKPLITLLNSVTGDYIPVLYWENSIGRSKNSDIVLADPTISRDHAVLMRRDEGWIITDTNSKSGVFVNGQKINSKKQVYIDDTITVGSTSLILKKHSDYIKKTGLWDIDYEYKKKFATSSVGLMFLVTIFHILCAFELCFAENKFSFEPLVPFVMLNILSWTLLGFSRGLFKRTTFELETLGILFTSIGVSLICSYDVEQTYTQLISVLLGMILFLIIIWLIEDPDKIMNWRLLVMGGTILLLVINLIFGTTKFGSQNWIVIGPVSIQPSEFVKVAFIFVGASTLDRLQTTKNLTEFIIFSGLCIGALFLMNDFGTALIFFVTFLIIAFMRSGDIRTIILIIVAAVLGVFMILKFKPYVADRFASWGHVWDYMYSSGGYQQTRVLTYSASGGLFGIGLGRGELKYIGAATSDLIFGMMCEEIGLIIALIVVISIAFLTLYSRKASSKSRSTFYYISACSASGLLLFQTCLNIFGATDILPLTGVTLPFVSLGGSSMISVWGLLAFIKAADERTYAARKM